MQKYTRLDIEQVTEFYLASEVDARIAELERQLSHAPIASLRVVDGTITRAAFYAPSLPDGHHDVWSAPVSERERIAELEKLLREARNRYVGAFPANDGDYEPFLKDCAVFIRRIDTALKATP